MKKAIFLSLFAGLLILSACSRDDEMHYKPAFVFSHLVVYPKSGAKPDTIDFRADEVAQCYVIDSVNLSDTLSFTAGLIGYSNMLTGFSADWQSADLSVVLTDTVELKKLLRPESDLRQCRLLFNSGYLAIPVSMRVVPQVSGPTHSDFRLTVESESKYSPSKLTFHLPVR